MGKKCFRPHYNLVFRVASRIINTRKLGKTLILSFVLFTFTIPGLPAPSGVDPQVKRALGCMDLMLYEEAISLFEQALAKDPTQPGLRTKQAYAYYRMNRLGKALEALNKELEAHPNDLKALILLSFVQFKTERPDDAEKTARLFQDTLEKTRKKSSRDKVDTIIDPFFQTPASPPTSSPCWP